jgi:hypothetical protein
MSELNLLVESIPTDFDPQNLQGIGQMRSVTQIPPGLFRYSSNLEYKKDIAKSYHYSLWRSKKHLSDQF